MAGQGRDGATDGSLIDGSLTDGVLSDGALIDSAKNDASASLDRGLDGGRADPVAPFGPATLIAELSLPDSGDEEPTLSPDQLEIYFARNFDIWRASRPAVDAPWSAPEALLERQGDLQYAHPSLAPDGLTLLYASTALAGRRYAIHEVRRPSIGAAWQAPTALAHLSPQRHGFPGNVTTDGRTLVLMLKDAGFFDLYLSTRPAPQEPWGAPVRLEALSSPSDDNRPWIDDTLTVFTFDSDRPGGEGGRDIYVSVRSAPSGSWSPPVAMESLNTNHADEDLWLSPDLRTAYFASDRGGTLDLYRATRP